MAHRIFRHEGGCGELHGHTYSAELEINGPVNKSTGMVEDFTQVKRIMSEIIDNYLDHGTLLWVGDPLVEQLNGYTNKLVLLNTNSTAENIAQVLYNSWQAKLGELLYSVTVYETPTSKAVATEADPSCKVVFKTNKGDNFIRDKKFPRDLSWTKPTV